MDVLYHLIDSRVGLIAAQNMISDLNEIDESWERYILLSSISPKEICHHANKGDYGDNCIVSKNNTIMWEWHGEKPPYWKPTMQK